MKKEKRNNIKLKLAKMSKGLADDDSDGPNAADFVDYLCDSDRVDKVLCKNYKCNEDNTNHRHPVENCKAHPVCVADPPLEDLNKES
jgi:hypothetical protein